MLSGNVSKKPATAAAYLITALQLNPRRLLSHRSRFLFSGQASQIRTLGSGKRSPITDRPGNRPEPLNRRNIPNHGDKSKRDDHGITQRDWRDARGFHERHG